MAVMCRRLKLPPLIGTLVRGWWCVGADADVEIEASPLPVASLAPAAVGTGEDEDAGMDHPDGAARADPDATEDAAPLDLHAVRHRDLKQVRAPPPRNTPAVAASSGSARGYREAERYAPRSPP
jgi:hypothetical protein